MSPAAAMRLTQPGSTDNLGPGALHARQFLRAFSHGNVRQLDAAHRRLLARFAAMIVTDIPRDLAENRS